MNSGDLCLYKGYQVTIFSLLFLWLRLLTSFSLYGVCWVNNRVNNAYRVMHIYPLRYDFCHLFILFHTVCFHLYLAGVKALWWYSWWWISLVVICGEIWSAFNTKMMRLEANASETLVGNSPLFYIELSYCFSFFLSLESSPLNAYSQLMVVLLYYKMSHTLN
jgi:hypothetical protein